MKDTLNTILDHGTDITGILVIGAMVLYAGIEPTGATLTAIVSIALGKKYKDYKLQQ